MSGLIFKCGFKGGQVRGKEESEMRRVKRIKFYLDGSQSSAKGYCLGKLGIGSLRV